MRDPVRMWGNPNTKKQSVFSSFYLKYTFFHGLHIMRLAVKVPLGTFPCLCLALLFNTGDKNPKDPGYWYYILPCIIPTHVFDPNLQEKNLLF